MPLSWALASRAVVMFRARCKTPSGKREPPCLTNTVAKCLKMLPVAKRPDGVREFKMTSHEG
jgi:hypothetical protein